MSAKLRSAWRRACTIARAVVGIPDYEAYAAHVRRHHPGRDVPDRAAFLRDRIEARYGRGRSRCC
ncbi:YbdD/YjiX family protein [Lysobacter xanthus]